MLELHRPKGDTYTMTINLRNDLPVTLIDSMGDDSSVVRAARVSTMTDDRVQGVEADAKLIDFLLRNRHMSPFEHTSFTFRLEAPIFVFREFFRHRQNSYNESSLRYTEMKPDFYVPPLERPTVQQGKPGEYTFVAGDPEEYVQMYWTHEALYRAAWEAYQHMLDRGVAREIARNVLPVGGYSTAYATMNARSIMSFLSLRTTDALSKFPSYPQWEIEQVARGIEQLFRAHMPATWESFDRHGRVGG